MQAISTQQEQFATDGYLLIRQMFEPGEVAALRSRLGEYLDGARPYPEIWTQREPGAAANATAAQYRKLAMITLVDPLFHQMVSQDKFAGVLQRCVGPNVCAWGSGVFLKQARTGSRQPWHRDGHGYSGPAATIWTPLMDATVENGCMQLVPGSHRIEPMDVKDEERRFQHGTFDRPIDVIEMEAGDSLIWDMRTLHSSDPNRSDRSRWALAVHCVATEAAIEVARRYPAAGPHEIIAGKHDPETASAARCMHCDRDAFARFRPPGPGAYR